MQQREASERVIEADLRRLRQITSRRNRKQMAVVEWIGGGVIACGAIVNLVLAELLAHRAGISAATLWHDTFSDINYRGTYAGEYVAALMQMWTFLMVLILLIFMPVVMIWARIELDRKGRLLAYIDRLRAEASPVPVDNS